MRRMVTLLVAASLAFGCEQVREPPLIPFADDDAEVDGPASAEPVALGRITGRGSDGRALGPHLRTTLTSQPCLPFADGPLWVEEGEPLEVVVRCRTGRTLEAGAMQMQDLPDGAVFDSERATLRWTPRLDQAAVYTLDVEVPELGERTTLRVGVADAFDARHNVPVADFARYTEEFGLPVAHLRSGTLDSEEYRPATLVYRGKTIEVEAKLRGRTSLRYPKRSFTLKFPPNDRFHDAELGFARRKKVVLITNFNDNSSLRHRLGFDVWNAMDPAHLPIRTASVVLYWNGAYHGIYTLGDHVGKALLPLLGLGKDNDLFKARKGDGQFNPPIDGGALHPGYEKKSGSPAHGQQGAYAELGALFEVVTGASDSRFASEFPALARLEDFFDWWIFATYVVGGDLVKKNHYLFHAPWEPFRYVPWDLDGTFGQSFRTTRESPTSSSDFADRNALFERLLSHSGLKKQLARRYAELLQGPLHEARVTRRLDELASEIAPAARRDERRWGALYRSSPEWPDRTSFNSFDDEIRYVRSWITKRFEHQSRLFAP
ncbi:MAG: CotH kinase family protein [Myxococcales bacterium]